MLDTLWLMAHVQGGNIEKVACVGREKSLIHLVCTCLVPQGFLGISVKLRYTNLREVCRLLPCGRQRSNEATQLFAYRNCPRVWTFQLNTMTRN